MNGDLMRPAWTLPATPLLCLVLAVSTPVLAASREEVALAPSASPVRVDVEVDPIAYALGGYSVHAGITWRRLRLDLGAFALDIPHWLDGNEGFKTSFDGYGVKLQYFLLGEQHGGFMGVDMGVNRLLVRRDGTELAARPNQLSVGLNAGWRFDVVAGFYVTPWVGLSCDLAARDVTLGDRIYTRNTWTVFPTVHLGYRFR
ncbi:hypothetical protein [Corallococcus sp. Z5C101001]|uniref:hypothetical protein n=1 Tax=Corallococcus sp. Z5C101001 TaxID=2596829 RepID=UPI00117F3563|nr:hypothetical protein [Corallococcus sp. Z5C101001]TSC32752.1 hypothetical protein FOF48_07035 [Corallococcus sp. Z5C101001]